MNKAIIVANKVMDAKTAGRLTSKFKDGVTYEIEDAENGNGLCYMYYEDSIYLSYRNKWQCYNEPAKVIQTETNNVIFA